MFEESGKKLQSIAIIVFIVNVIAFIILAITFGWTKETYSGWYSTHTETVFHAGAFFGFLLGGIGGSYVECLALYAFGELVENSSKTEWHIREYVELSQKRDKQLDNSSDNSNASRNVTISQTRATSAPVYPQKKFKTCPKCGEENPSDRAFCYNCGESI